MTLLICRDCLIVFEKEISKCIRLSLDFFLSSSSTRRVPIPCSCQVARKHRTCRKIINFTLCVLVIRVYLEEVDKHEGYEGHYNFFESLISG